MIDDLPGRPRGDRLMVPTTAVVAVWTFARRRGPALKPRTALVTFGSALILMILVRVGMGVFAPTATAPPRQGHAPTCATQPHFTLPAPVPVAAVPTATVEVTPPTAELDAGDPGLQLVVTWRDPAGTVRDLTAAATWTTEPPGVVEVLPGGLIRPAGAGRVEVVGSVPGELGSFRSVVTVADPDRREWSFAEDVEPHLTRLGCNAGGCHGRQDGQNGFHLSLFGYDGEGDYRALTRESAGRRVDRFRPEASLLLTKATGSVPHAGGMKLTPGSAAYRTLLAWIKAGAPEGTPQNHGRIARLAVEPADARLDGPGPRQLRVVATYADGHARDVTRLAQYKTNDDATATVDDQGRTQLLRRGEADIVVRYGSLVATTRLAASINPTLAHDFAKDPRANFVDDEVLKRLQSLGVPPSPASSDAAFFRRVALDLTGEQPSPDRVRDFLKDADPAKRPKLVRTLIGSPDFVRFWQIKLGDLLEITSARPDIGTAATLYQSWLKRQLIDNVPWDQTVRTLLTATGDTGDRETGGPVAYALEAADPKVAAEKAAQRFLGLRLRCAQCHDHPFDVWTQDDYFGLAATFAKVQRGGGGMMGMMGNRAVITVNPEGNIVNPRTRQPAAAKILGGPALDAPAEADPRVRLADWVTAPDNPFFPRAMANWTWAQFFGRGIVDPPDDLSRSNPPVHPELLDALARHFVAHKFDLRDLIATIATSATYGATSATVPGNQDDDRLFSHQRPRPLTAHQMADALAQATDVVNRFRDKPAGTRAIEIVDPATPSTILETFGRCSRINGCAAVATPALSLRQSLLVIGGDVIEAKVAHPQGYLANLLELAPAPDEVIENLYLRTLCRPPTAEEQSHWAAELAAAPSLREAAEDLFWALLNSREFAFNH